MESSQNRICLCLSGKTFAASIALLQAEKYFDPGLDLVELRLDFILDFSSVSALEASLTGLCQELEAYARIGGANGELGPNPSPQFILTLRKNIDGGLCPDAIEDRSYLQVVQRCVSAFPASQLAYVDLDAPLLQRIFQVPQDSWICEEPCKPSTLQELCSELFQQMRNKGARLLASIHDFGPLAHKEGLAKMLVTLEQLLSQLPEPELASAATLKFALMAANSQELLCFYRFASSLQELALLGERPYVLLAMGEFGSSSRILQAHVGSQWTFCSPSPASLTQPPVPVALGQFSFCELIELYGYRNISPKTSIYGVVGDPIGHSRSPEIHNPVYQQQGWDAVYLRFRADTLESFLALSPILPIRGISATVPHKETLAEAALSGKIAGLPCQVSESVKLIGASNTLYLSSNSRETGTFWTAENTDINGFLEPLLELLAMHQIVLRGKKAAIIGAGGAAKAVIYALLGEGVNCEIYNRTTAKAQELKALFGNQSVCLSGRVTRAASLAQGDNIPADCDLLIQTTSVGMCTAPVAQTDELLDPIANYAFRPGQIAYDLIYQPVRTVFLQRAEQAGAIVLNGSAMLEKQAMAQIKLFGSQYNNSL